MDNTFSSNVDEMISSLEASYAGDRVLTTSESPKWTNTCLTCVCDTL